MDIALAHEKVISTVIFGKFRGNLDPLQTYSPFEFSLISCLFPRLVRLDDTGNIMPDLAKSWSFDDDGKTVTFNIEGSVTAPNVVEYFKTYLHHSGPGFHRSLLQKVVIEGPDWISVGKKNEIKFRLRKPYPPFLYLISSVEFAIPGTKNANSIGTIYGQYGFNLTTLVPGREYRLISKTSHKTILAVTVEPEAKKISTWIKDGSVDLVLGLPEQEVNFEMPSSYDVQFLSTLNSQLIHFNRRSKIFTSKENRSAIARLLRMAAAEWTSKNSRFRIQRTIVPRGLMPSSYYEGQNDIDKSEAKNQLLAKISRLNLNIWMSSDYFPGEFKDFLVEYFTFRNRKVLRAYYMPFTEALESFKKQKIEMIFVDPGAFFPDPDSYIEIWSNSFPRDLFPFPAEDLLSKIGAIRFNSDRQVRIKEYSRLIRDFEKENWIVPMFELREPVIKKRSVEIFAPDYRYLDSLCSFLKLSPG